MYFFLRDTRPTCKLIAAYWRELFALANPAIYYNETPTIYPHRTLNRNECLGPGGRNGFCENVNGSFAGYNNILPFWTPVPTTSLAILLMIYQENERPKRTERYKNVKKNFLIDALFREGWNYLFLVERMNIARSPAVLTSTYNLGFIILHDDHW